MHAYIFECKHADEKRVRKEINNHMLEGYYSFRHSLTHLQPHTRLSTNIIIITVTLAYYYYYGEYLFL